MLSPIFVLEKTKVVLNGQHWSTNVEAGFHQESILEPLLFRIYMNDLPDDLTSNPELFVDGTSLFSVVQNINWATKGKTSTIFGCMMKISFRDLAVNINQKSGQ